MSTRLDAYQLLHDGALALSTVEQAGIRIDVDYCRERLAWLDEQMMRCDRRLRSSELGTAWIKRFGTDASYNSGLQLQAVLYADLKVKPFKQTESGLDAVDEESLKQTGVDGIAHLLRQRSLKKVKDVLGQFLRYQIDGYLYPNFNLHTVVTYRSSSSEPNCFPPEVEVLTRDGWVAWDKVSKSTLIGQVDLTTMEMSFSEPNELICYKFSGNLIHVWTDQQISILSTSDHQIPLEHRRHGGMSWFTSGTFPGDGYKLYQAMYWHGGHFALRWSQVALICAMQADAYVSKEWGHIEWCFKKRRKFERLLAALNAEGIWYKNKEKGDRFRVYVPRRFVPDWLVDKKSFGNWIFGLSHDTLLLFATELCLWDGSFTRMNEFYAKGSDDAGWAQIIYILTGRRAAVRQRPSVDSEGFNFVGFSKKPYSLTSNSHKDYIPYDSLVYCATMPLGTLIIRHNGLVSIVGNCQNIPKRDKWQMDECRRAIVPSPGNVILEIDFKAIEVALACCLHKDPTMLAYLRDPASDMHADQAIELFFLRGKNADLKKVNGFGTLRQSAKNGFIFPEFYGDYYESCAPNIACGWLKLPRLGDWTDDDGESFDGQPVGHLLRRNNVLCLADFTEHVRLVEKRFWEERFPVYSQWKKDWYARYQRRGSFQMKTGFVCSGVMARNAAVNYPIQGPAFHVLLMTLILMVQRTRGWASKIIGEVHDSGLIDAVPSEVPALVEMAQHIASVEMSQIWPWIIAPLSVESAVSEVDGSWAEMKEIKQ